MTISAWATLASEPTPDQAWTDTVALLVLDATTGTTSATELGQLRNQIADKALTEHDSTAPISAQLRLLVVQLDAAIWRRQTTENLVANLTGRRAKVIHALHDMGGTAFTDDLCAATGLRPPHISKLCGELLEAGLLIRQSFGKRAEWTLVPQATPAPKDQEADTHTEQLQDTASRDAVQENLAKIRAVPPTTVPRTDVIKWFDGKGGVFGTEKATPDAIVKRVAAFQKPSTPRFPKS